MSAPKHTPGPWSVFDDDCEDYGDDGLARMIVSGEGDPNKNEDGLSIAFVIGGMPRDMEDANARLLAAAPDLLEALRPLAECEVIETDAGLLDSDSARYFITMGEIRAARAAIAKATGTDQ